MATVPPHPDPVISDSMRNPLKYNISSVRGNQFGRIGLMRCALAFAILAGLSIPLCDSGINAKKVTTKLNPPAAQKGRNRNSSRSGNLQEERIRIKTDSATLSLLKPMLEFSGFDKPASSAKETFLITNNSDTEIVGLLLEITYLDLQGRMIHRRNSDITVSIPPAETRMVELPTFDVQKSLYYKESNPPSRYKSSIPFDVRISVKEIYL